MADDMYQEPKEYLTHKSISGHPSGNNVNHGKGHVTTSSHLLMLTICQTPYWALKASNPRNSTGQQLQLENTRRGGSESEICSVMSNSLWLHGLYNPWHPPGQNTGVGSLSLLQGSSQPRDWTQVSLIAGRFFISWVTREAQEYWSG